MKENQTSTDGLWVPHVHLCPTICLQLRFIFLVIIYLDKDNSIASPKNEWYALWGEEENWIILGR